MNLKQFTNALDTIEIGAVALVSKLSSWAAPFPTAYIVYVELTSKLRFHWIAAFMASFAVEALGIQTMSLALELYSYNKRRDTRGHKTDPPAPLVLPVVLVIVYFATVIILTVVIHDGPYRFALALFPIVSLAGSGSLAIRQGHAVRLRIIDEAKAERKRERQERESAIEVGPVVAKPGANGRSRIVPDSEFIEVLRENPLITKTALAERLGVSRPTVHKRLDKLVNSERIVQTRKGYAVL